MKYLLLGLLLPTWASAETLFDGKSLNGWTIRESEKWMWRVEDGVIVGGSMEKKIPHNTFITSAKRYGNFELTVEVKVTGNRPNAGIQFRSERIKDHHEMIGYQADAGPGLWGRLYDESRRRKFLVPIATPDAKKAAKKGWNKYRIRCEESKVRIWVNEVLVSDYLEKDPKIPKDGLIALQAHSGPSFEVRYRAVSIKQL
ncbi:MAG: 3-keto-disaccharide hydrolase [Akkermansiaceae bacterium]